MNISDLTLQQAILEFRFSPQYQIWDCAGSFWSALSLEYPNIRHRQVSPNEVIFQSRNEFELSLKLDLASVTYIRPQRTLADFKQLCKRFLAEIDDRLGPPVFDRVGCRLMYEKHFDSLKEAQAVVRSLSLANVPQKPQLGVGQPITPEFVFNLSDDQRGASVRISASERSLNFDQLPLIWAAEELPTKKRSFFSFDVDQYLIGPIRRSQFTAEEWLAECLHRVNRDSNNFLE